MRTNRLQRRIFLAGLTSAAVAGVLLPRLGLGQEKKETKTAADQKKLAATVAKGIEFLKSKQDADGALFAQAGIGITALAVSAFLQNGLTAQDPAVAKALKVLEGSVQPSGGIHAAKSRFVNYETCLCVMALSLANKDGKYEKQIKAADKFIKSNQFDGEDGHDKDSSSFGGGGYGGATGRPDLSNTAFMVEALRSTGTAADDQAIQNSLIFVSRCQNLESPHNTTKFAALENDGGFYYTGALDDPKESDLTANGGLRSYGTMTYAGLKSLLYAGVKADDPRVKAATGWIAKNYDLKNNPGMGANGLFYYYQTFAKTLDVMGEDTIKDAKGIEHDWRKELVEELASRQRDDGGWVNTNKQWLEGDDRLCTAFALLALSHCKAK